MTEEVTGLGQLPAPSDHELLRSAVGGNQHAWTELVQRYNRIGMRRLRAQFQDLALAEDIMQQVWEALLAALTKELPNNFAALFSTILKRRAIDQLRRKGRSREATTLDVSWEGDDSTGASLLERQIAPEADPADALLRQEHLSLLERAMASLPDHYRVVIDMRQLRGRSNRETAARLVQEGLITDDGNIEKRAENYYYRGLDQLKKQLLALGVDGGGGAR
jgi:RNA polymerase sigma-70 factor (ECF subfamily)